MRPPGRSTLLNSSIASVRLATCSRANAQTTRSKLVDSAAARDDGTDLLDPLCRDRIVFEQMAHESDPLNTDEELAKTQMPGHTPSMPQQRTPQHSISPRTQLRIDGLFVPALPTGEADIPHQAWVVWSTATAELAAASCRYRTEPASGTPGRQDYGMSLRNVSGQSTTDPRSTARAREPGAQALVLARR